MYKSVVVVDDSEMESQITKRILFTKSFAENVETFNSAMAALIYLNSAPVFPDVIFLDLHMPIMDGFDFLNSYVKFPKEKRNGCKVVILSGSHTSIDFDKAKKHLEIKAILQKPLQAEKLEDLKR
jgi:CheY-like chemotaxis protein